MLRIKHISLAFTSPILNNITFEVKPNEIVGIAGQSGAGKTSLLKIIAGLVDSDSGTVHLENKRIVGPSQKLIPGYEDIQLVNQDFNLDIYLTCEENVKSKILHLTKNLQASFVDELLELLELNHVRTNLAHTLSGGEQQRLAIARALAMEPKVLLLDEPFVHLDSQLRIKLINYLIALKEVRKMSLIIVSHNSEELLSLTDRILHLKNGKISRIASPNEFYYNYKSITEGRVFGIVNRYKEGAKSISFRPDEFEIDESATPQIPVQFVDAVFMGSYYLSNFVLENGKKIILLDKDPLIYVRGIKINKKDKTQKLK